MRERQRVSVLVVTLIFLALSACLYALSWNSGTAGFLSDDAVYLLMADGFSPFTTSEPTLTAYVMREAIFPPLYPMLLALLGAGSESQLWAHLITTTTLVLALGVYGLWINSEIGDRVPAMGLVLVFALAPATLFQNLEILSEFPYLLFTLTALWLVERVPSTSRRYGLAALLVGLATVTRTAGLSLLVAFAIWLVRHRVRGGMKWFGLALIPGAAWYCYKKWILAGKVAYTTLWSSLQTLTHPSYLVSFLENQSKSLWQGLLNTFDLEPSLLTQAVLGVTLMVGLPVWIRRLRVGRLDAWYLLIGGMMTFLYPFPTFFTRLFLPWVPIVLFYAYLGVCQISAARGEVRARSALPYAFLAVLFLALVPSLSFIVHRLAEPIPPELANWKHTRYWFRLQNVDKIRQDVRFRQDLIDASREVAHWVPVDECAFGVHTGIPMLYSHRVFQQPPSPDVGDTEFEEFSHACNYFFLMPLAGQLGDRRVEAYYPNNRLARDRIELVQTWEDPRDPSAPTAVLLREKISR